MNSVPKIQPEERPKHIRRDTSNATAKASRFVIAAYLFGAKFAEEQLSEIPFCSEVHTIIAKYLISKRLLEERVQPAELFEFFDENTAEYEELCRILDYSDGDSFAGAVAEKYFKDCVTKLKLYDTDKQIAALTAEIEAETANDKRKILAFRLQKLIKQKEKLKSGDK